MTALNVHLTLSIAFCSLLILGFVADRTAKHNSGAVACLVYALVQIASALMILNP